MSAIREELKDLAEYWLRVLCKLAIVLLSILSAAWMIYAFFVYLP